MHDIMSREPGTYKTTQESRIYNNSVATLVASRPTKFRPGIR